MRDAQILSDQASQWLLLLTAAIPRRIEVAVLLARTLLPWSLASWTGMKLAISFQIVVVLLVRQFLKQERSVCIGDWVTTAASEDGVVLEKEF